MPDPFECLTTFFTRSLAAGVPPLTDSGRYGLLTRTSFITTMAVLSQRTGSLIICIGVNVKYVRFQHNYPEQYPDKLQGSP